MTSCTQHICMQRVVRPHVTLVRVLEKPRRHANTVQKTNLTRIRVVCQGNVRFVLYTKHDCPLCDGLKVSRMSNEGFNPLQTGHWSQLLQGQQFPCTVKSLQCLGALKLLAILTAYKLGG